MVLIHAWVAAVAACLIGPLPEPAGDLLTARMARRVSKTFDFNEVARGNYEAMPMGWRRVEQAGRPRFGEVALDDRVGGASPPSLRLDTRGGGVAVQYVTWAIDVHPQCEYAVTASVRTERLRFAGARVGAFYLDHGLREIAGSRRESPLVRTGGALPGDGWTRVSVRLPSGGQAARWLGLACEIEQPGEAVDADRVLRPLRRQDVAGTAWFDDIEVLRLPTTTLEPAGRTAVFTRRRPPAFEVGVTDLDAADLSATFVVADADGREVFARPVAIASIGAAPPVLAPQEIPSKSLRPGQYSARLQVHQGQRLIADRTRAFACVAEAEPRDPIAGPRNSLRGWPHAGGLGLVLDVPQRQDVAGVLELVDLISPAAVKLPLWHAALSDEQIVSGDPRAFELVDALGRRGIAVVGVLDDVPAGLAARYDAARIGLLDVLCGPADVWRPYLALTLTRYGSRVAAWQIGRDERADEHDIEAMATAVRTVRSEIHGLLGASRLAEPRGPVGSTLPAGAADVISVQVAGDRALRVMGAGLSASDTAAQWHTIWPATSEVRPGAAGEVFARNLVLGLSDGAELVFVPQPWHAVHDGEGDGAGKGDGAGAAAGAKLSPTPEFVLVQGVSRLLSGLQPLARLSPGGGAAGQVFGRPDYDRCVVALWREEASEACAGREAADDDEAGAILLDLGESARYVDATGRALAMYSTPRGWRLPADSQPGFLVDVSRRRAMAQASFSLEPPQVAPGPRWQRRRLVLGNAGPAALRGELHLTVPDGWAVSPSRLPLELAAGGAMSAAVSLRVPSNQPSGGAAVFARLTCGEAELDGMSLRAAVRVCGGSIDAAAMARAEDGALHIVHRVTNLSPAAIDLRSVVVAPGQPQHAQYIRALGPGQTAVRAHRVEASAALTGRPIRVSAEQVDGPIRDNRIIITSPDPSRDR